MGVSLLAGGQRSVSIFHGWQARGYPELSRLLTRLRCLLRGDGLAGKPSVGTAYCTRRTGNYLARLRPKQMASGVTSQFLVQGYAYSLEQCGLLLRDANILYRTQSYASTVVLATLAIEELGKSTILLDFRRQVLDGETITRDDIEKRFRDQRAHITKQEAGMLSIDLTDDDDPEFGKLLRVTMESDRQSPEWQAASAALARIQARKRKRLPTERHQARTDALYVDLKSESEWKRPVVSTSRSYATTLLRAVVENYARRYHDRYISSMEPISQLQHRDPKLYDALYEWSDRPELPRPEWPPLSP
jgi:AbiV family abortive infection protein